MKKKRPWMSFILSKDEFPILIEALRTLRITKGELTEDETFLLEDLEGEYKNMNK